MRIRETWGHSWRSGPGERRWHSTSVYYSPFWALMGLLAWAVLFGPYWLAIEFYALIISGLIVLFVWWRLPAARYHCQLTRWHWFWYLRSWRN